jgi:hypothetical protein
MEKYFFAIPTLEILGHTISAAGLVPMTEPTAAIYASLSLRISTNCNVSWHGKLLLLFPPGCTRILRPLTDLLRGGTKTLEQTTMAKEAFQSAKRLLAAACHSSLSFL